MSLWETLHTTVPTDTPMRLGSVSEELTVPPWSPDPILPSVLETEWGLGR